MDMQGSRQLKITQQQAWDALNDPEVLKACIAGCESLERVGDDGFAAVMAVKVGPVSARFKGNLKLSDVKPPNSYTIHFDGQGGVAGHGKGSADVSLLEPGQQTVLSYAARAQVGGKLAQVGSRLVDAAAGKIAEDFFKAFEARLQQSAAVESGAGAVPAAAAPPAVRAPAGGLSWLLAAAVIAALIYFLLRSE